MNHLKAVDLDRILRDVIAFSGKDDTLPMLWGIRLESDGKNLIAAACDRFTLGASRCDYAGDQFDCVVPLDKVKLLMQVSKTARRQLGRGVDMLYEGDGWLTCTFTTGEAISLQVDQPDKPKRVRGPDGKFQTRPNMFPPWKHLIPAPGESEAVRIFGVNPEYMARFAKVGGGGPMAVYPTAPGKIIVVRIGEDFVGGIMPVRLPEGSPGWERPAWLGPLPKPKTG